MKSSDVYESKTPSGRKRPDERRQMNPRPKMDEKKYRQLWKIHWLHTSVGWGYVFGGGLALTLNPDEHRFWEEKGEYHMEGVHLHPDMAQIGLELTVIPSGDEEGEFFRLRVVRFWGMDTYSPRVVMRRMEQAEYELDLYKCDNCGHIAPGDSLPLAEDLLSRLTPGGIFTDRECDKCEERALCFPMRTKPPEDDDA